MLDNPDQIVKILERLGCHHIKVVPDKRVTSALPDGDNPTSVQVLIKDEKLATVVHTRNDYKGGDIYSFIEYMLDCNFRNALMYACNTCGVPYTVEYKPPIVNRTYSFMKNFFKHEHSEEIYENETLPEGYLDMFINAPHKMFVDEYMTPESQKHFGIRYDIHLGRILIPIRDLQGNLVTVKGRIATNDFDKLKTPRYLAYENYRATNILYGYHENYWDILMAGEVIVVESEKGVIQAHSYGFNNAVALSKKKISEEQLFALISLNVDVTLALDKDVSDTEIEELAQEFKGLCKVYQIKDEHDYLDEKDSPTDKGIEVFKTLYNSKKKII